MSVLYRPVLIESVEQAEALPMSTLARHSEGAGMDHAHKVEAMPGLARSHWVSSMGVESNAAMIGWVALVPVEAKEERQDRVDVSLLHRAELTWPARTRLVTPWEEA